MIQEILHQVIGKCFLPGLKTSIRVIQRLDIDTLLESVACNSLSTKMGGVQSH